MIVKTSARVILLLCCIVAASACSKAESPEAEIRRLINSAVEAAEARDAADLAAMLHPEYQDANGYNQKRLASLLRAYFFRHKNIHLFTRIDSIELLADNQAQVRLHVAMAGSVIADVDALSALRARVYAFELGLVKQDQWLLRQASWRAASIADL